MSHCRARSSCLCGSATQALSQQTGSLDLLLLLLYFIGRERDLDLHLSLQTPTAKEMDMYDFAQLINGGEEACKEFLQANGLIRQAGTKEIGFEQDRNNKIGKNGTQNRVSEI